MTVDELCNSYLKVIDADEKRWKRAVEDRRRIRGQIEVGEVPDGHRTRFITETAVGVIGFVGDACLRFDQKYLGDRATTDDCLGVLLTATNMLLQKAGKRLLVHEDDSMEIVDL